MCSDRARAGPLPPPDAGHHRKGRSRSEEGAWRLETDWPEEVPVTTAEVEVVERFLGDLLDELLGGAHGAK